MSSVDDLPGDQRAVLQLVLARGRSYDEIARLLSINPNSVRERARAALDAIGPQTRVSDEDRARIGDYLLGQLPADEIEAVRDLLAHSASERAWARVLSSELGPVASGPLPDIPVDSVISRVTGHAPPAAAAGAAAAAPAAFVEEPSSAGGDRRSGSAPQEPRRRRRQKEKAAHDLAAEDADKPRSSRLGGLVLIVVAVALVVVILIKILGGGSSSNHAATTRTSTAASVSSTTPPASTTASTTPTTTATTTTTTTSSPSQSSTSARILAQITLSPPTTSSKATGLAEVLDEGSFDGIAIVASNLAPNTTSPANAYAVWLYNSASDAHILGFVNPGVGANGRLSTIGRLPSNAAHYKQLLVTLETSATPRVPGQIVLQGTLTGL